MLIIFNFWDYIINPIVSTCVSHYKDAQVLSLNDCLPDIMKLKHSRWCLENDWRSSVGNQLRMYYASISNDLTYIDADCLVQDPSKLLLHHRHPTNDGTYFRANKDTDWVKFYLAKYDEACGKLRKNGQVFTKYPAHVPTQLIPHTHYYVSFFYRFPLEGNLVYCTRDLNKALCFDKPVWCFCDKGGMSFGERLFCIDGNIPLDLFIEQLYYAKRTSNIKLEWI